MLVRDDGRRHDQDRCLATPDPFAAQLRQPIGCRIGPPVRREIGNLDPAPANRARDIDRDGNEVSRRVGCVQVDEVLQRGQREAGGRVDDGGARAVPAPAGQTGAFPVECGVPAAADAPDARQL